MNLDKREFRKMVKFLKPAIGNNEGRKNLMHVHVSKISKDKVRFMAADAFCIKYVEMFCKEKFFDFLIPRRVFLSFDKILPLFSDSSAVLVSSSLMTAYGDVDIKYKQPEIEYPDLSRIINTEYKEAPLENYTALLLRNIQNCIKGFGEDVDTLKILLAGAEKPVKIVNQPGDYTAILMPVRIKW